MSARRLYQAGQIVANDTPRNLKLAHSQRTMLVTLSNQPGGVPGQLSEITLSMDNQHDQLRLTQWLAQDCVRATHSQEATLEEVFLEVAGVRPA
ncbi:hypothetical protein [Ktedonosporobacter rubrisoli]|uniref:hypothetical protein n=1 Tax=Ktedonosporobacter rubrisoli TaxID=2509675 RepID=UPI001A91D80C|nr:hypothetical protein [Ktedonosporobacter rubrisoli]